MNLVRDKKKAKDARCTRVYLYIIINGRDHNIQICLNNFKCLPTIIPTGGLDLKEI